MNEKALVLIEPLAILLIGSVFGLIITGVVLAITSANDMVLECRVSMPRLVG